MRKLISILTFLFLASAAHAETVAPDTVVKNTANEVLETLKSDKDIANGSKNKLGKIVEEKIATKFDFDRMSRLVLGSRWNEASKEQQERFIAEFRSLLIRTYSSAIAQYRDQTIEYKPLRADSNAKDVKVMTKIIQPGGPAIALDYSLWKIDDAWKVYDVSIDGLSLVTTYRGQFAEAIKQSGIDGLTQRLSEKNKT